jgi:hypothetical protein
LFGPNFIIFFETARIRLEVVQLLVAAKLGFREAKMIVEVHKIPEKGQQYCAARGSGERKKHEVLSG